MRMVCAKYFSPILLQHWRWSPGPADKSLNAKPFIQLFLSSSFNFHVFFNAVEEKFIFFTSWTSNDLSSAEKSLSSEPLIFSLIHKLFVVQFQNCWKTQAMLRFVFLPALIASSYYLNPSRKWLNKGPRIS